MGGKFEVYVDAAGEWRFRLKARNGEIVAVSEGYSTKAGCKGGVEVVRSIAPDASLVEIEASPHGKDLRFHLLPIWALLGIPSTITTMMVAPKHAKRAVTRKDGRARCLLLDDKFMAELQVELGTVSEKSEVFFPAIFGDRPRGPGVAGGAVGYVDVKGALGLAQPSLSPDKTSLLFQAKDPPKPIIILDLDTGEFEFPKDPASQTSAGAGNNRSPSGGGQRGSNPTTGGTVGGGRRMDAIDWFVLENFGPRSRGSDNDTKIFRGIRGIADWWDGTYDGPRTPLDGDGEPWGDDDADGSGDPGTGDGEDSDPPAEDGDVGGDPPAGDDPADDDSTGDDDTGDDDSSGDDDSPGDDDSSGDADDEGDEGYPVIHDMGPPNLTEEEEQAFLASLPPGASNIDPSPLSDVGGPYIGFLETDLIGWILQQDALAPWILQDPTKDGRAQGEPIVEFLTTEDLLRPGSGSVVDAWHGAMAGTRKGSGVRFAKGASLQQALLHVVVGMIRDSADQPS